MLLKPLNVTAAIYGCSGENANRRSARIRPTAMPLVRPEGSFPLPSGPVAQPVCQASRLLSACCHYRRSARTDALVAFACANAAIPLWLRMLYRVRFADSSAMLASRIRLSAAFLLTTCEVARLIA